MSRRVFRSTVFALVLGFVGVGAGAAPLPGDRERASEPQVKRLPHVLVAAWERLTMLWEKNGSGIDPFGKPAPGDGDGAAPQEGGDNGSVIDPFG